jgi:hypothetical protein
VELSSKHNSPGARDSTLRKTSHGCLVSFKFQTSMNLGKNADGEKQTVNHHSIVRRSKDALGCFEDDLRAASFFLLRAFFLNEEFFDVDIRPVSSQITLINDVEFQRMFATHADIGFWTGKHFASISNFEQKLLNFFAKLARTQSRLIKAKCFPV